MASPCVGLYIGAESASFVVLSGSFFQPRLLSFGKIILPLQGSWRAQVRAEETSPSAAPTSVETPEGTTEEVTRLIQDLLVRGKVPPSARFFTAVSSEAVLIRYFQMPLIPAHERKVAVAFEARKYLPFKLEDLVSDFQVVVRHTDPSMMRVMFFGMKKGSFNAVLSLLKTAGVDPLCLETPPVSFLRTLRQSGQLASDQVAAILYVERDSATICIARSDLLYLTRNVTVLPQEGGLSAPSPELLEALSNETRVSIDYYRRRFLGEPAVGKIILFAKDMAPPQVQELATTLDLPLEIGEPFRKIADSKEVSADLAIAAGLALRGFEKSAEGANLLPREFRKEAKSLGKTLALQAGAACLALAVWFGFSVADLTRMEQKIADVRQQQMQLPDVPRGADIATLEKTGQENEQKIQFLRDISKAVGGNALILCQTVNLLPADAWFRQALLQDNLQIPQTGGMLPVGRKRLFRLSARAYLNDRDKELEGISGFLNSLRSDALLRPIFTEYNLDGVQRGRFLDEDVTEFRLSCASSPDDLRRSSYGYGTQ